MTRATPEDVKAVNGSTLSDPEIQVFIDTANIMINNAANCAGVDEDTLKQAEIYLTCHLMLGAEGGGGSGSGIVSAESIDTMSISYSSNSNTGIKSTNYGNTADQLMMGCLSKGQQTAAKVGFFGGA